MYVHTTQAASLLGISTRRLRKLLSDKRVKGAYKSGKCWLIALYEGLPVIIKAKRVDILSRVKRRRFPQHAIPEG